nr:hypothetical protein [Aerococcus urinae]MDL5184054.1 hypothetical protein [Aerococcus mictus]
MADFEMDVRPVTGAGLESATVTLKDEIKERKRAGAFVSALFFCRFF